jgi:hypothetical protein
MIGQLTLSTHGLANPVEIFFSKGLLTTCVRGERDHFSGSIPTVLLFLLGWSAAGYNALLPRQLAPQSVATKARSAVPSQ